MAQETLLTVPDGPVNWSMGVDTQGRPIPNPEKEPAPDGRLIAPDGGGLTNYRAPSVDPRAGLFIVDARPSYGIYFAKQADGDYGWAGAGYGLWGKGVIEAIDYQTGKIRWSQPAGPGGSGAGVLATDSGLTISGDGEGNVLVLDTATGNTLWHAGSGAPMRGLTDLLRTRRSRVHHDQQWRCAVCVGSPAKPLSPEQRKDATRYRIKRPDDQPLSDRWLSKAVGARFATQRMTLAIIATGEHEQGGKGRDQRLGTARRRRLEQLCLPERRPARVDSCFRAYGFSGMAGRHEDPTDRGRDWRLSDTSAGHAVVNKTFLKTFFNGENPVGKS